MSAEQKGQKDGEVTSEGDSLRGLLYKAGLIALAPALLAFVWLGLIREPLIQSGTATTWPKPPLKAAPIWWVSTLKTLNCALTY